MGNCCMRSSSSMVWAGDDWGSMGRNGPGSDEEDKESLLGGGAELRIKISKKQLRELLKKADEAGGVWSWRDEKAPEKVLESLIQKSVTVQVRRRAWRPKLQTIPE